MGWDGIFPTRDQSYQSEGNVGIPVNICIYIYIYIYILIHTSDCI